jgi:hypothetical protein
MKTLFRKIIKTWRTEMAQALKSIDTIPTDGNVGIDDTTMKALREIVDERYEISFDRSRLISASDLHREAKRIIGAEMDHV